MEKRKLTEGKTRANIKPVVKGQNKPQKPSNPPVHPPSGHKKK